VDTKPPGAAKMRTAATDHWLRHSNLCRSRPWGSLLP